MITVYAAKKIITMDRNMPEATHVAVRDGLVLAVGGPDCANSWVEETRIDDSFADRVFMPGLIEAHAHVMTGGVSRYCYVGHYPRTSVEGGVWEGAKSNDAIVERLREVAVSTSTNAPVIGWGFDPAFVEGPRLDRNLLDKVSREQPVVLFHSNFHVLTANSKALEQAGLDAGADIEGLCVAPDGTLTGELQEFKAMTPVMNMAGISVAGLSDERSVRDYGRLARSCGVTTIADLSSDLFEEEVRMLLRVTSEPEFPIRYAPVMAATEVEPEEAAARARALGKRSTSRLCLGSAKLFTDGTIQGRTAKLKPPGYLTGRDNGIWNMDMDDFRRSVRVLHEAGVKIHIHANGDEATEESIRVFEAAMLACPNPDLRHTLEHAQLAGVDQFKRMRALGLTVNLFANHLHYFGDVHWTSTVGPDRARRMNACADAWRVFDGDFAIHSDSPVTPLAPLKTAWCAVNRQTESGRRLGDSQQLTVPQALHCITMGAAYVLKLDDRVGSIQCGKQADFCVLGADPLEVDPGELDSVPVIATILGGEITR